MKKLVIIAMLVVLGAAMGVQAQTAAKETIKIKTNAYTAKSDAIFKDALPFVKGVISYDLCPNSGTLTVVYNPKRTTIEKIRKEITKLGFDADEFKGDAVAKAKLPKECITAPKKGGCSRSCGS